VGLCRGREWVGSGLFTALGRVVVGRCPVAGGWSSVGVASCLPRALVHCVGPGGWSSRRAVWLVLVVALRRLAPVMVVPRRSGILGRVFGVVAVYGVMVVSRLFCAGWGF